MHPHKDNSPGAQFGLMNAMRTGNIILDTIICMLIPAILPILMNFGNDLVEKINRHFQKAIANRYAFRSIRSEFTSRFGYRYYDHNNNRNDMLQKAIKNLITIRNLKLNSCDISFTKMKDYTNSKKKTKADEFKGFVNLKLPPENEWFEIISGLEFMHNVDTNSGHPENSNSNESRTYEEYKLRALNPNGEQKIDSFLEEAVNTYVETLNSLEDANRYLYILQSKEPGNSNDRGGGHYGHGKSSNENMFIYKKYQLSSCKTFDTLFIKEKDSLLKLIEHFTKCTGKYAIPGYPHKLGLLLHGPPGTVTLHNLNIYIPPPPFFFLSYFLINQGKD